MKRAACAYWNQREGAQEKFILTDEYFNNLATYKDTVQNFFAEHNGYLPMNSDCYACVFLMLKNETRTKLHPH